MKITPPRTYQGIVSEHHAVYPSFRIEGVKQWFKMPFESEHRRPAVGRLVTVTVDTDGAIISLTAPTGRLTLRERIIRSHQEAGVV